MMLNKTDIYLVLKKKKKKKNTGQRPLPPGRLVLGSPIPISSKGSRSGSYSVLKTFHSTSWDPNKLVRVLKHNGGFCFVLFFHIRV